MRHKHQWIRLRTKVSPVNQWIRTSRLLDLCEGRQTESKMDNGNVLDFSRVEILDFKDILTKFRLISETASVQAKLMLLCFL